MVMMIKKYIEFTESIKNDSKIDGSIIKDILNDISDETNCDISYHDSNLYDIDGISFSLSEAIDMKYIDVIKKSLNYYKDETGIEILCLVALHKFEKELRDFRINKKLKIAGLFFFINDNKEVENLHHDCKVLSPNSEGFYKFNGWGWLKGRKTNNTGPR